MKVKNGNLFTLKQALEVVSIHSNEDKPNDKLTYACSRVLDRLKEPIKKYYSAIDDINVENCMTGEKGELLYENLEKGIYKFNKEGIRKRKKDVEELNEKEIDIEPYLCSELPERFSKVHPSLVEELKGFVIAND